MAMYDKTTKYRYQEDETLQDATYSELKFTASGSRQYYGFRNGVDSLEDIIEISNRSDAERSPELGDSISKEIRLGETIPRLLYYPQDLGHNARYKHFVVFNIYQGESEAVQLDTKVRLESQAISAVLAGGGNQWGLTAGDIRNRLEQGGFAGDQLEEALRLATNVEQTGITNPGIDFTLDDLGTGGNWFNFGVQVAEKATEEGRELLNSLAQTTDYLDPKNQTPRNYNQIGRSGRPVNRPKSEQNILLANRRFNNANVKSKDTICLYMPQKIAFNDQLVYNDEEMGALRSLSDALTGRRGGMAGLVERGSVKAITDIILGGAAGVSRSLLGGDVVSPVVNLAGDLNLQAARNANTRSAANPRREMLFKEAATRNHQFSFEFFPKNPEEADTVLDIIRLLRYHAYPGLRSGGAFLTFPAEFELTFYTLNDQGGLYVNDNLPKIPRLALQSIVVDYSPTESFKTFPDSKPAFIRLDLTFTEMEQLTNEHIIHGY